MPFVSALRMVLRLTGFALIATLTPALMAQSGSAAADGFDPNFNGGDPNVYAIAVQANGQILVAGDFTALQPNGATSPLTHQRLVRLKNDGAADETFNPDVNGRIRVMLMQPDGRILIGGDFTTVNGTTRKHAARLMADGSLDASFDPNTGDVAPPPAGSLTPEVMALALQPDGKILVGGGFVTVQPNGGDVVVRKRIARFNADGTLDASFAPAFNAAILSIAVQADGKILVGGGFTVPSSSGTGYLERDHLARLNADGTLDSGFDPKPNGSINAMVVQADGKIVIGGGFTNLTPNGGTQYTRANITRINADGTLDTNYKATADGAVSVLLTQPDGRVLVAGSFTSFDSSGFSFVARMQSDGTIDTSFGAQPNFNVYALALQSDASIIMGGAFTALRGSGANSVVRNHLARVSMTGALDANFRPDANGRLRTFALQSDGKLLVAGTFTSLGGETHYGLARLDDSGAVDPGFTADIGGTVSIIVPRSDGKILIGGSIFRVNSIARQNIALLNANGSADETFNTATNGPVSALAVQSDGKVLIGGTFSVVQGSGATTQITHYYLARLNADGTLDDSFTPTLDAAVTAMVVQGDGKILIGGEFTSIIGSGSTTRYNPFHLARLNADGTVDSTFSPGVGGAISSIVVQSDNKILIAGQFKQVAGTKDVTSANRSNIARLNADGTVDADFDPEVNGIIWSMALQSDGKILIGGTFDTLVPNAGTAYYRNYVARLKADGTLDTDFDVTLDTLPGNEVFAVGVTSGGQPVLGGSFNYVTHGTDAPVLRSRLVRLNANGSVDAAFDSDAASATGAPVEALAVQISGRVLAAGSFSYINGTRTAGVAMFRADGAPDTAFVPNLDGPGHAVAQLPTNSGPVDTQSTGFAWLTAAGSLRGGITVADDTFLDALTVIQEQPDGKLLMGGGVGQGNARYNLIRLNADGSVDSAFKPLVTDLTIYCLALQSDGKILVGGSFTNIGGTARTYLARLNSDGSLDTSFVANPNYIVNAIVVQPDGKIVIGGSFTSVKPDPNAAATTRNYIARLNGDGTVDTGFDPNANGSVLSLLLQADGKILTGGSFTAFSPNGATTATTRNHMARLNADGTLDSLDLAPNGSVQTLRQLADGSVLAAGGYSMIGGKARNYLARIKADGTVDDSFNPNPNSSVFAIAEQDDGKIIIGGNFTALQPGATTYDPGVATPRSHVARLNADGTIDGSFNPNLDGTVSYLTIYSDGTVLAGGSFATLQPAGSLVVGGAFSAINGLTGVTNIAAFGSDGSISSGFQGNANAAVYALLPLTDGRLFVGGAFTTIAGAQRNRVARYLADKSIDPAFNPNANDTVYAFAIDASGRLLIGGAFTNIGGGAHNYLARFKADGTIDSAFNPAVPGAVHGIVVQADGRILVLSDGNGVQSVLARYIDTGAVDSTFSSVNGGSAAIDSFALQTDGKIVVGGAFTNIAGVAHSYLARLNDDGTLDPSLTSTPNGPVTAVTLQPDGKIVLGGMFSAVDGLPRFGLARLAAKTSPTSAFTLTADRASAVWIRSGSSPEIYAALIQKSTDGLTWTDAGSASRIAGTTNWRISGLNSSAGGELYLRMIGLVASTPNTSQGLLQAYGHFTLVPTPVITSATAVGATTAADFVYAVAATDLPTTFSATGLPAGLSIDSTTGLITGRPTQTGTFDVTLSAHNDYGDGPITMLRIVVTSTTPTPATISRLVNISINAQVTSSDRIIGGFVIGGTQPLSVLLRAVGPTLTHFNITSFVTKPHLRVFSSTGNILIDKAGWDGNTDGAMAATAARVGAYPLDANSMDTAVLATLAPGVYTMHVLDDSGTGGTALAEVYDASTVATDTPRLMNISGRSVVNASSTVAIGGFVINGTAARRVLIRGVGPGLTAQGVTNALSDPTIKLFKGGTVIASNDNWETPVTADSNYPAVTATELATSASTVGAFSLTSGSKDAALIVTLAPGVYTAQVSGVNNAEGSVLTEIYELP